jgi:hypothetical protein
MADFIKRALTRRRRVLGRPVVIEEPDETLVYVVKFATGMTACLSALEIAHLAFLGTWNGEVFSAITGLIGIVTGILLDEKRRAKLQELRRKLEQRQVTGVTR